MTSKDWLKRWNQIKNATPFPAPSVDNPPIVSPLYESVKYTLNSSKDVFELFSGQKEAYLYSRYENPNSLHLKKTLAALCSRKEAVLYPSGIAAITSCLDALVKPGDHVLFFLESYAPTKNYILDYLSSWGIRSTCLSIEDTDDIEKLFSEDKPDLMIFESPSNPQLKILDMDPVLDLCQKHSCLSLLDNTYNGFLSIPDKRVDVVIHSLTKFASGHSDIMGGMACSSNAEVFEKMDRLSKQRGVYLDPYLCHKLMRSLETYFIRHNSYLENTKDLASMLGQIKAIKKILHPSLASFPQKTLAEKYQINSTTIYAELADGKDLFRFIDRLKVFAMSPSLGCNESLIAPAKAFYGASMSEEELKKANIGENSFRLSIGLDSPDLLLKDIETALF